MFWQKAEGQGEPKENIFYNLEVTIKFKISTNVCLDDIQVKFDYKSFRVKNQVSCEIQFKPCFDTHQTLSIFKAFRLSGIFPLWAIMAQTQDLRSYQIKICLQNRDYAFSQIFLKLKNSIRMIVLISQVCIYIKSSQKLGHS